MYDILVDVVDAYSFGKKPCAEFVASIYANAHWRMGEIQSSKFSISIADSQSNISANLKGGRKVYVVYSARNVDMF